MHVTFAQVRLALGWKGYTHHQFVSQYGSHLYCHTFAETFVSGFVGSGRRLHFLPVEFLPFSSGSLCNLVRASPQYVEKIAPFPRGENSVECCHVSGCHVLFGILGSMQITLTLPHTCSGWIKYALHCIYPPPKTIGTTFTLDILSQN